MILKILKKEQREITNQERANTALPPHLLMLYFFQSHWCAPALQADTWALPLLRVGALTSVPSGAARSYGNHCQFPCKAR